MNDEPLSVWVFAIVWPLVWTVLVVLLLVQVVPWMVRWLDRQSWSDWLRPRFEDDPPYRGTKQRLDELERRVTRIETHLPEQE
jgi:hypothetical protein